MPATAVFMQGVLSFFSPCVLPVVPLYIGYLAGGTLKRGADGTITYDRRKVVVNTIFFVLGISFAFVLLGTEASAAARALQGSGVWFARICGVLVIAFGLLQLGVFGEGGALKRERRLPFSIDNMTMSPLTALIMGFTFSFAWTPCVGPVLASVLLMAASESGGAKGFLLILLYTVGFALPFLLTGLFTTQLLNFFQKHRNVVQYTTKVCGVIMIALGLLMVSGRMNMIGQWAASLG